MRRRSVLALVPLTIFVAGGCSAFGSATPPDEALATAQIKLAESDAVTIDLSNSGIPKGHNGVSKATGTGIISATEPKFKGQITGVIKGNPAGVELIAIGDKTWMSFFSKDFNPIDMADLSAPNPADLFHPETGVGRILTKTTDAAAGDKSRDGKVVLQSYTGKVPASEIQALLLLGDAAETFDVTYGIEPESGELRTAKITGEFYEGHTSTFTLKLSDYGKTIDIPTPAT